MTTAIGRDGVNFAILIRQLLTNVRDTFRIYSWASYEGLRRNLQILL